MAAAAVNPGVCRRVTREVFGEKVALTDHTDIVFFVLHFGLETRLGRVGIQNSLQVGDVDALGGLLELAIWHGAEDHRDSDRGVHRCGRRAG